MIDEPNPSDEAQGPLIAWDVNRAAIAEVAEEMKDIDAYVDHAAAKKAKKKLVAMRSELTEYHKTTKAKALAFGKLCDTEKNELMALIRVIEDPIGDELDKIKNAAAREEEVRVGNIMGHIERIQAFALDRHSLTLPELEERLETLRAVEIEVPLFEEYAEDAKLAKDEADLKLRLAIDRVKQENKEKEDREELERKNKELQDTIDKQNAEQAERDAAAKKEQDERDAAAKKVADAAAAEQKEKDDARQKELDDQQTTLDAEKKRIADEEADRLQKEQDEIERIAKEEADAAAEAEAQKIRDLQAPDVDKLTKYAEAIDRLIEFKPVMGSTAGNGALLEVVALLVESRGLIKIHIEEMK